MFSTVHRCMYNSDEKQWKNLWAKTCFKQRCTSYLTGICHFQVWSVLPYPKRETSHCIFPPHTVLIKGFLCTRGRLCSALSAQHFQSAPLFVFQADLLALGQIISLTSFPWKVRSVSDSAQVTSGNTRNRKGGMGERTTLNLIAGGKIKYSTAYTMHLPYLIKAGCLSDNASC